ncbi:DUF945 domain-containing protein [Paenalcaligenes niemegkensis]|uniref:DUF945 domain-containing protein n=1 Tax=Paenalcaligenes niemegkensis TaxID=2895469 RepID=UPI001EE8E41A|nr:DUF945 domain-containing protein [Paenalcaligenes niemegkensis]MCQ9616420.1 DUF945 domain-containing protein [Paenalcaligenes niemegkensis]
MQARETLAFYRDLIEALGLQLKTASVLTGGKKSEHWRAPDGRRLLSRATASLIPLYRWSRPAPHQQNSTLSPKVF